MEKKLNKSMYLTGDELISNLDKKTKEIGDKLKKQIKEDRNNLKSKKEDFIYG